MEDSRSSADYQPYGLPCVREVLRFIISLTSPLDSGNNEAMHTLGLHLVTVALDTAAVHMPKYTLLLPLIQNQLCRWGGRKGLID